MWDDVSGSVWSHLDGIARAGPAAGQRLDVLPLQTTSWRAWLDEHPETTVLDVDTGFDYRRQDTLGGNTLGEDFLDSLGGVAAVDPRLPIGVLVVGVLAGEAATAFPADADRSQLTAQADVGDVPIVLLEEADGQPSLAFHRMLSDGRVLDFFRRGADIVDVQTGSRWSPSGLATAGPLAGVQLAFVTSFLTEWYGWSAFYPATSIAD